MKKSGIASYFRVFSAVPWLWNPFFFPGSATLLILVACGVDPKEPIFSREIIVPQEKLEQPFSKALADLDGDGNVDALIGDFGNKIYWYHYPKWEQFILSDANGGDDLAVVDINKDGAPDVVSNGSRIAWYENPKGSVTDRAARWKEHVIKAGTRSHDLVAGDINGDNLPDVGIREENGLTLLFLQTASGDWTEVEAAPVADGVGITLADMNGDGKIDVVGSGYWLQQPSDSPRSAWTRVDFAAWLAPCGVAVKDMNGDGRPDVVLSAAYNSYRLSWFENSGQEGPWSEHVIGNGLSHVHRFHVLDLDKDGYQDVVFAEQHQSKRHRVGVMLNADGMGDAWTMKLFSESGAHNLAIGDIGNDGTFDLLAVNWSGDTSLRLLLDLLDDPKVKPLSASPTASH